MNIKRFMLFAGAAFSLMIAFIGLFPFTTIPLIARVFGYYTVGLSMDVQTQVAAIGGAAAVAAVWTLATGLRTSS